MADFEKSQMQALCNQRRAAQLIERILTIRTRLMDPFSFAGRNESKKAGVRIHRNGQVRFFIRQNLIRTDFRLFVKFLVSLH